ncbi:MAG: aldehyde ferredoxin oxidoreductase family protein [Syntrophaceae bacterium]|jgi:aldehyde:ferredoxin oxidoreductase|nr:aldehyde ferredoxin oxidoreductase family protein [Syntrophaceae bacterium]
MKEIRGTSNRYLFIDLTNQAWRVHQASADDLKNFLGGKGLALKIYYDLCKDRLAEIDPLGPDNLLIFANGVLLTTGAPCSARFEVLTRSPLTGYMVASSCGGPFGEACKTAGWDGVIVAGRAEKPVVVRFDDREVVFEDAGDLWGAGTRRTQEELLKSPKDGAAVIGPAGENQVLYANICSGHRFAGRGGVGAVMGAKHLKALVARGKEYRFVPVDREKFARTLKKAKAHIRRSPFTQGLKAYGTNMNTRFGIDSGYTPVRNFRDRYHPRTEETTGEVMARRYNTRHSTCRYCSVLCGHKGMYPDGKMRVVSEYETTGMFGSNIGNFDTDRIGVWNEAMNDLGMDTISAGGTIAWAMEAGEKGLRQTELSFDHHDNIGQILEDIACRRGEGTELADGTKRLSEKYGGKAFAMHTKGLEFAAYDPRGCWGHGLSYAVHNKGGCHLGSYLVSLEVLLGYMPPLTTLGKASWVVFCEDVFAGINSLQTCLFTALSIMTEPVVPKYLPKAMLNVATIVFPKISQSLMNWSVYADFFSAITGIPMNQWQFKKAGERITKLERYMNVRMGQTPGEDTLPDRFTKEAVTKYPVASAVPIARMVRQYYRIRKYDPQTAGPSEKDLRRLGIAV